MGFRFIHAADVHLGYEQYNLPERAADFARAYIAMVEHARDVRADFILIAGDLFHRSSADAWMLKQATFGLSLLREAGIPVLAVEGNHDTQHARKQLSWMEYLCDQELLSLLNVEIAPNGHKSVVAFDPEERRGSWIDVAGARVYGMKYYGAATARFLEEIQGDLQPGPGAYTIMMLHAGMAGQVPHLHGGLTMGQIEGLRPAVDYLALGHVHKRLQDDWAYNPGSLETNSMEEINWPHGFFDVQVDAARDPKHVVTPVETPCLRAFHRLDVHTEGDETLEAFVERAEEVIAAESAVPERAVLEVDLSGVAGFRRQEVPVDRLKGAAESRFKPLVVRVRNNLVPPGPVAVRHGERMRRPELERTVVEQMVYQDVEYRDRAAAWTTLILDVKNMAANRETPPATIADHVQRTLGQMENGEEPAQGPEFQQPAGEAEPEERLGGEPPCYAHLLEDEQGLSLSQ
jgi:DNA repair exonuclease SbcCD nuclease subunit